MKDLFCLVNSFISRSKTSDRSNHDSIVLSVPFEATEDFRVLPGASHKNHAVLTLLEPFLQLLPDLRNANLENQKILHSCLYSAGVSAALSLHQYLYNPQKNGVWSNTFLSNIDHGSTEWKEILNQLGKYIDYEESAEAFRKLSQKLSNSDLEQILRSEGGGQSLMKMISNEVAAAALAAFASATFRRPPTKYVESIMAPAQEAGAVSTDDENCGENFSRSIRDSLIETIPLSGSLTRGVVQAVSEKESSSAKRKINSGQNCLVSNDNSNSSSVAAFASEGTCEGDNDECECEYIEDEDCLFRYVCAAGYEDLAKLLVELRNSAEFTQRSDSTPIMEACCGGHADVVRILINAGANVNAISSTQNTALIYACGAGHVECVKELLKSKKCDLSNRNENGHCALMEAASIGNIEILKDLVKHGATPVSVLDNLDFKESALTLAAYKGHVEAVEFLISVMPDNADREEEFHTALMEASMDGHVEVTRALLNAGAPVNLPSDSFESPLTLAACGGHTELVGLLIDFGADLEESNDEGYTPLMEASREGHRDVVELLLDRGANVNTKIDEGMETPLTLSASGGFLNVVELLVSRGGDVTIGSPLYEATQEGHGDVAYFIVHKLRQIGVPSEVLKDLNSCLLCAAEINNVTICNMLLENNAQIDCLSHEGRSPLMEAARQGNLLVVELLVHKGANVNALSPGGDWTALSLAATHGHADIVRYLLEHGSNPHQSLKDSSTCLLEATKNGQTNCVEVLLDYAVSMCPPQCGRGALNGSVSGKPVKAYYNNKSCNHSKSPGNNPKAAIYSKSKSLNQKDTIVSAVDLKKPHVKAAVTQTSTVICKPNISTIINNNKPEKVYTDKDYANAFSALLQQQEQLIQQHISASHPKINQTSKASQTINGSSVVPASFNNTAVSKTSCGSSDILSSSNASQLFRALAAAAASSSSYNGPDDWLFAQFIQRSLITTKKRETMSEEELRSFTEMIQHQFRTIFSSGQVDAAALALVQSASSNNGQQHLNLNFSKTRGSSSECSSSSRNSSTSQEKRCEKSDNSVLNDLISEEESGELVRFSCCRHNLCKKPAAKPHSAKSQCDKALTFDAQLSLKQKLQKEFPFDYNVNPESNFPEMDRKLQEYRDEIISQLELEEENRKCSDLLCLTNMDSKASEDAESQINVIASGFVSSSSFIYSSQKPQFAHSHHYQHSKCHQPVSSCCNMENHVPNTSNKCSCSGGVCTVNNSNLSTINQKCAPKHSLSIASSATSTSTSTSSVYPSNNTHSALINTVHDSHLSDTQIDGSHDTALTLACVGGHTSLANLLFQRGADIEHRDKKGFTPLILAATGGHLEICKMLIEAGCQVDAQADRTKDTALSLACSGGRKEVVDYLLRNGANKEHRNISDYTPLSLAASGGYVDIIQLLLNNGAEINSRTGSKLGISPLMLSAMNGHEAATMLLLDSGSDINAQIETNRNTALTLACFQGRTKVVRILVQYGANVEHRAKTGLTPLMEAANGGYVDVGTILLEANADANAAPVMTSRDTALTIAADKGHAAFAEMLIHAGAQINARNKKGCSALWLACSGGYLETVRTLVKHNADTDSQDNRKVLPLMVAFRKGHISIVEFLVFHVSQFPSDQECSRYITTLSDLDGIAKCNTCLEFISQAKAKQAEEANKAAESLLEILAQEKALAESKKRTKQRQKEKKKAKKNAKKQTPMEDEILNHGIEEKKEHAGSNENIKKTFNDHQLCDGSKIFSLEKETVSYIKPQIDDLRVPLMGSIVEEHLNNSSLDFKCLTVDVKTDDLSFGSTSKQLGSGAHKSSRRQTRRGGRGGGGGGNNNNLADTKFRSSNAIVAGNSSALSFLHSKAQPNAEESEWLRASKRRVSVVKGSKSQVEKSSVFNAKSIMQNTNHPKSQINNLQQVGPSIDEWVAEPTFSLLTATSTKRKSHVMSVSSSAIARVIGRAGSNINAIREATNAHIEVEKMTTKREQATRMITIKGTSEAIKNSIFMIEMLIKDQDIHILEILRHVMGNNVASDDLHLCPQRTTSELNCFVASDSISSENIAEGLYSSTTPVNEIICHNQGVFTNVKHVSSTNVWQQRAAIRELQNNVTCSAAEQESDNLKADNACVSGLSLGPLSGKQIKSFLPTNYNQHLGLLPQERKAPGFERPNSSSSNLTSVHHSSPCVVSANNGTLFTQYTKQTEAIANSHLKKDTQNQISYTDQCTPRPLSDIWENSSIYGPLSPPTSMNLTCLFGNGGVLDSTTALWLPQIGENSIKQHANDSDSQVQDTKVSVSSSSDWLGEIFPSLPNISSNGKTLQNKATSCQLIKQDNSENNDDDRWDMLKNWNPTAEFNSVSEFKWDTLVLEDNRSKIEKSEVFEASLKKVNISSSTKKEFDGTQFINSNSLQFSNDIRQPTTQMIHHQQLLASQQPQQQSMFTESDSLYQHQPKLPISNLFNSANEVKAHMGFSASLPTQPQQSNFSFVPHQEHLNILNSLNNGGISNTSFCRKSQQQNFHSTFPTGSNFGNNQQNSQNSIFNGSNNMQSSNFVHPPPGFGRQPNVSSTSFYDSSLTLNRAQMLPPIGSKVTPNNLSNYISNFCTNNSMISGSGIGNLGNHHSQQSINFFSAGNGSCQLQQPFLYKSNGFSSMKYNFPINSESEARQTLKFSSNHHDQKINSEESWKTSGLNNSMTLFGQRCPQIVSTMELEQSHQQQPSQKAWESFE